MLGIYNSPNMLKGLHPTIDDVLNRQEPKHFYTGLDDDGWMEGAWWEAQWMTEPV